MATEATLTPTSIATPRAVAITSRKFRPIVAWAAVGAAFLAVEIYTLTAWGLAGPVTTPTGPTPVPTYMQIGIRTIEMLDPVVVLLFLYFYLFRPWRREGRISTDGLLLIGFWTIFWQDMMPDVFQPWALYNTYFWNFGSWYSHLPGWLSPNGGLIVEPPFLNPLGFYVWTMFGGSVFGCWMLKKLRARAPHLSTFALFARLMLIFMIADFVGETILMLLGAWVYPGAPRWLTFWSAHYYQFPIFEPVLIGLMLVTFTAIRYFRNDKGETLAERGLSEVRLQGKKRTALRFLALTGICQVAFLVYNGPAALVGLYADDWPKDITSRSYFTNNLCGPLTDYHCSGPGIPIPRRDSAHLDPQGKLVTR